MVWSCQIVRAETEMASEECLLVPKQASSEKRGSQSATEFQIGRLKSPDPFLKVRLLRPALAMRGDCGSKPGATTPFTSETTTVRPHGLISKMRLAPPNYSINTSPRNRSHVAKKSLSQLL